MSRQLASPGLPRSVRRLRDTPPACIGCGQPCPLTAPRISVGGGWRCSACQYRHEMGRSERGQLANWEPKHPGLRHG